MKITRGKLRMLIKEAIQTKPFGSPEGFWVNEGPKPRSDLDTYELVAKFANSVAEDWRAMDDGSDPSIKAAGKESWEDQVAMAEEELASSIHEAISAISSKLIQGEFFVENNPDNPYSDADAREMSTYYDDEEETKP